MTTWERFLESPWQNDHGCLDESDLAIHPAPEYASSEVLVAALYRRIGMPDLQEKDVPNLGRDLMRRLEAHKRPDGASLGAEAWSRVLQGAVQSPKLPNQSQKRFLQLTPLVPEAARVSGSARLSGHPWLPGNLIERMVTMGSPSRAEADALWRELFDALSVNSSDDVWARWLESELVAWRPDDALWALVPIKDSSWPSSFHNQKTPESYPARQFCRDLVAVLRVKDQMTRRQWITLLESVLRIGAAAHVLWLCEVNCLGWTYVRSAMRGGEAPSTIFPRQISYFRYGTAALDRAKETIARYLDARMNINAVLWGLEKIGAPFDVSLSTQDAWEALRAAVHQHKAALIGLDLAAKVNDLGESEAKVLNCSKGIGMNMLEFIRHAAGQRQTAQEVMRGYDQGYCIRKRTNDPRSRWIVAMGPVAVIAMAHCCLFETGGARSVHRLCEHLARYGIVIGSDEVASSDLGHQLRLLSLVLDSPDAESGMLVLPPFDTRAAARPGDRA